MSKDNQTFRSYFINFIYAFSVFISVLSLSSWNLLYRSILPAEDKLMLLVLGLLILATILADWTLLRLVGFIIFILIGAIYYHLYKANYFTYIMLALAAGSGMKFKDIVKIDFFARIFSTIFIVFLSLIAILPRSGTDTGLTTYAFTSFTYGFTYPNVLGYLILIILVDYCCLKKHSWKSMLVVSFVGIFIEFLLNYATGVISLIILTLLFFFLKSDVRKRAKITLLLVAFSIPIFTVITTLIAKYYNNTNNTWNLLNKILSLRPPIWQYYYNAMPLNFFGSLRTINKYTLGVIGSGAFDGAYIVFLLQFGIFSIIFLSLLFLLVTFKERSNLSYKIICYFSVVTVISSFPETLGFLTTYSPLFFLLGSFLLGYWNSKDL